MLPITRLAASAILLTAQACASDSPPTAYQQSDIDEWLEEDVAEDAAEDTADPMEEYLNEMADASAPIAVQSGLCGYWDPGYWQIKIISAEVSNDTPGLAERFRLASLKEVERLQQDSSDRMPCGSGLRELALMYLTDWSMISDDY